MSYIFLLFITAMVAFSDASNDSKLIAYAILFAAYRTEETLLNIKNVLKSFKLEESEEDE